ncbi:MAG: NAD(P)H-hydrate dehydratase [Methanosarcinaceae archaeon]|nr:NAD(P)H-hydrate dehydratase [Methanosarcinaceae archaeon]
MLVLAGTVPLDDPYIIEGTAAIVNGKLKVSEHYLDISAGTSAMGAAATITSSYLGIEPPYCVLAGDLGQGDGSTNLYSYLRDKLFSTAPGVVTLHYMMPKIYEMVDFGFALEESKHKPLLVADAGAMYGAKISGIGHVFDLFTPDKGEMAFLADPDAAHPMFVNENLYDFPDERIPEIVKNAYRTNPLPYNLLIKGSVDYVVQNGSITKTVDRPNLPAMEAVGGTGDTLTGIVSALIQSGESIENACYKAAMINRIAGEYCKIKPNTQIPKLINSIPQALEFVMDGDGLE